MQSPPPAGVVLFYEHLYGLGGLVAGAVGAAQAGDIHPGGQRYGHLVGVAVGGEAVEVGYTVSGGTVDADGEVVEVGCRGVGEVT